MPKQVGATAATASPCHSLIALAGWAARVAAWTAAQAAATATETVAKAQYWALRSEMPIVLPLRAPSSPTTAARRQHERPGPGSVTPSRAHRDQRARHNDDGAAAEVLTHLRFSTDPSDNKSTLIVTRWMLIPQLFEVLIHVVK